MKAREGGTPTTEFSVPEIFPAQNYAFFFHSSKTETQRLNMARNIYKETFKNINLLSLKSTRTGNYFLYHKRLYFLNYHKLLYLK